MIADVETQGFTPALPSGPLLGVTQTDLLLHMLVAGKPWLSPHALNTPGLWTAPTPNAFAYSWQELCELSGLVYLGLSHTETGPFGEICSSPYFHQLESTTKAQASARLGVAITSLLAWRLLGIGALHHVSDSVGSLAIISGPTKSMPDLIGQDPTLDWVVLEAKGRIADTAALSLRTSAKNQAKQIKSVQNTPPKYCVGSIALLRSSAGPIKAFFADPEPSSNGSQVKIIDERALYEQRYGPVGRAIASGAPTTSASLDDGQEVDLIELPGVGYLGVVRDVANVVREHATRTAETDTEFVEQIRDASRRTIRTRDASRTRRRSEPDQQRTTGDSTSSATADRLPDGGPLDLAGFGTAATGDGIVLAVRDDLLRRRHE